MSVRIAHALRNDLGSAQDHECNPEVAPEFKARIPVRAAVDTTGLSPQSQWHLEFSEAISPLRERLHRLARRILRSEDLAEDAVQEALTSLWREQRLPANTAGWLCRAVVNRSLHLNRCRKRRRIHEERACLHRFEFQSDREVSRALESQELGSLIEAAIAGLPEPFREVFVLREVEEMEYDAIAEVLRVPVGTVRSRLSRSRRSVRKTVERVLPDECASLTPKRE